MTNPVSRDLRMIDSNMAGRSGYTSVFLIKGERAAILDSGVSVNAKTIMQAVEAAGVEPENVAYLALTHAHYDHAGGAHELLRLLGKKGNHHVKIACSIKPSVYLSRADICKKLIRSGRATEGDLAGEIIPVAKGKFQVLDPGDVLDLGGITIRGLDAPGHANGHMAFYVPELDFLYTGDACGLLARTDDGSPVIAPSAFAPEYTHGPYLDTLRSIREMEVPYLGFGHFGILEDPSEPLEQAIKNAETTREIVMDVHAGKRTKDSALESLEAEFGDALLSLYPEPERMLLVLSSMITGHLQDLSKDK